MRTFKRFAFIVLLTVSACDVSAQQRELYKDGTAPVHDRVMDLLSRLTVEEKIRLLRATSPGIPRLGIPKYYHGNEACTGLYVRDASPCFRRPSDWLLHGIHGCSCKWQRLYRMRPARAGTSWNRGATRNTSSATCLRSGRLR